MATTGMKRSAQQTAQLSLNAIRDQPGAGEGVRSKPNSSVGLAAKKVSSLDANMGEKAGGFRSKESNLRLGVL